MFTLIDEARRQAGFWFDAAGLGKDEAPFRVAWQTQGARLRAYGNAGASGPAMLIVAAPFKGPYIWDLLPQVSVVRRCLDRGFRVYLLEWARPGPGDNFGLEDYCHRFIADAVTIIQKETGQAQITLAGHSLGGTFAAVFASLLPGRVLRLLLVDAPLSFGPESGPIAQLAKALPDPRPLSTSLGSPIPGSALTLLSLCAVPEEFILQRYQDLAASLPDPQALALHLAIIRWTLDEFPMTARLFEETLQLLYREDRFVRNALNLSGERTGIGRLRAPVLAVLNPASDVVPSGSVEAGLRAIPELEATVLVYEGDRGAALQHVGPLVGRNAHERLWPKLLTWIEHGES